MATPLAGAEITREIIAFADLDGWEKDNQADALTAFLNTCQDMKQPDWRNLCAVARAQDPQNARAFFELFFRPVVIRDHQPAMFTGYFEPELDGARRPGGPYRYPVYKMPPEAKSARQWLTRNDILNSGVMQGRGLEIAWVDDPVELFFLQIQGSGRIRLTDGSTVRVGYGGSNGRNRRSVGVELVRRGIYKASQVSAEVIGNWVRRNPEAGRQLLLHNPSYVFFREVRIASDQSGPLGAMNRSITALRTVAVDPKFVPLGAPVWLEKDGAGKMRRLMIAQDTGSAIKGAQRADVFFGTGRAAGLAAGQLRDPGRMVVFLPIQRAYAMMSDDGE